VVPDRHASAGPAIDIADETYVRATADRVAPLVADPAEWRRWWPDLLLTVTWDRGIEGQQWRVSGPLVGDMEIWLEPVAEGTVVHWFLRADPSRPASRRVLERQRRRRVLAWKAEIFALKDVLERVKPRQVPAEMP